MQYVDIKNYSEECLHNIVNMIIMKNDIIYDMKEYIIRINVMYYTLLVQLYYTLLVQLYYTLLVQLRGACVCVGVCMWVHVMSPCICVCLMCVAGWIPVHTLHIKCL